MTPNTGRTISRTRMAHCSFFVKRKARFCRLTVAEGQRYCGEHLQCDDNASRERVPCPYDSQHTVYADQLQKHAKKCNSKPKPKPDWHVDGINSGLKDYTPTPTDKMLLKDFSSDEIQKVIDKIEAIPLAPIESVARRHPSLEKELLKSKNCPNARKHLEQQASLIGHMSARGLLTPDVSYAEFGAGKGKLSHWVQNAIGNTAPAKFILIDRQNCRNKMDSYHRKTGGPEFRRILIDIKHLYLGKALEDEAPRRVIGLAKHLCGSATDMALRCLMTTVARVSSVEMKLAGLAFALCCHHKCEWSRYVGRDVFARWGLTGVDFRVVCLLSSWATCVTEATRGKMDDSERRRALGRKCKDLIDAGRREYLHEGGAIGVDLVRFVDSSVTLENSALLAFFL